MDIITKQVFIDFIIEASAFMQQNKDYLCELDAALGDGDLGLTMTTGFSQAKDFVTSAQETDLGKLSMKTGMIFAKAVPSTMGTLVASAFMKAGKSISGKTELTVADTAIFAESFVTGIMERGKAQPGGRTIIDSIYPAANAIKKAAEEGKTLIDACADALEAAKNGVEATKNMLPTFGRAVYFGEKTLGTVDQGAIVGMLIYDALYKAVLK